MQTCPVCIKVNVSAEQSDLNHQGEHYDNQDFKLNENSPTLNLPHVEFPSAEQEGCRTRAPLAKAVACVRSRYYCI